MTTRLDEMLGAHRREIQHLFRQYIGLDRPLLLRSDLVDAYESFCETPAGRPLADTPFTPIIHAAQEAVLFPPLIYLSIRLGVAGWSYVEIHADEMRSHEISVSEFLRTKERVIHGSSADDDWVVEIDLRPFERGFPKMRETRSIGRGVEFLNRHLSSRLFADIGRGDQRLFDFLKVHEVRGKQMMLNGQIRDLDGLREALGTAHDYLRTLRPNSEWTDVERDLVTLGFEPGWGRTVPQVLETMGLLSDILEAPSPHILEHFLSRIPMIFSIAIISPHGYFGQADVLGKPDTGGQVVYILDQVRALERAMRQSIHDQGLDIEPQILVLTRLIPESEGTTCSQRIERIHGTEYARILRIPFRDLDGAVIRHWISRFQIWPHLERFAHDAATEMVAELGEPPDFIIGNYSDGNLVASMLSSILGVTQCNIAHALEKTKYLHSDLYWKDHEADHHFDCQYTADLISMNTADFIITSTYQEIAGTRNSVGQYESYRSFTMPGLYRVLAGIDTFDPKFNIVAPGADAEIFFPYHATELRLIELHDEIRDMVFGKEREDAHGSIRDPDKPLVFAMSRLDRIKNMTGLVEWFGRSPELRREANLFVVGGFIDPARSSDTDERSQIERMHSLFEELELDGQARWLVMQSNKSLVGELYRFVADTGGIFVQPALFEAFGLTVIEAMTSGLPTFATCYGGPLETIEHGVSGFHLDPNHGDEAAARMAAFLEECRKDPDTWRRISTGAIERVESRYTWELYAERLLALSRIYGFWKFISNIEREETSRYLQMFYGLMFRPLAQRIDRR
jgi:sucrose synthase